MEFMLRQAMDFWLMVVGIVGVGGFVVPYIHVETMPARWAARAEVTAEEGRRRAEKNMGRGRETEGVLVIHGDFHLHLSNLPPIHVNRSKHHRLATPVKPDP
jgi:hypothetical protein